MRYKNKSPFWRQAGDALIPPFGETADLDAPPLGADWEPVAEPAPATVVAESVPAEPVAAPATAEEPAANERKRKGGAN